MSKHTPGPWGPISEEYGNCERDIEYPDDRDHCLAVVQCGDPDELLANARLIAAAPELLAALEHVLDRATMPGFLRDKVKAAIAKATGATA